MQDDKTKQFIEKANKIHSNRYDYSKTLVIKYKSKITIICNIHGEFSQRASSHLEGYGCKLCSDKNQSDTLEKFIEKASHIHHNKYDYSLVIYNNNRTKIKIICIKHGVFDQAPRDHLSGKGCPSCKAEHIGNIKRMPIKEFISKASFIHHNIYDYSLVEYKNNATKIKIICAKHGIFEQKALHHLNGSECPLCANMNDSKSETSWLDSKRISKKNRNVRININGKIYNVDAYIPRSKTIYEFYGDYWHGNINLVRFAIDKINKTTNKTFGELYEATMKRERIFRDAGYKVVSVWEYDWKQQNKNRK